MILQLWCKFNEISTALHQLNYSLHAINSVLGESNEWFSLSFAITKTYFYQFNIFYSPQVEYFTVSFSFHPLLWYLRIDWGGEIFCSRIGSTDRLQLATKRNPRWKLQVSFTSLRYNKKLAIHHSFNLKKSKVAVTRLFLSLTCIDFALK